MFGRPRVKVRKNTAPMWKKLTVLLSGPVLAVVVLTLVDTDSWNFFFVAVMVVAIIVGTLWLMSRLLGVHLSLGSWD